MLDVPIREPDPVYLELSALLPPAGTVDRTSDDTALALAAAAIDYHRREQKSFWWDHFRRLTAPVWEWADGRDVLIITDAQVLIPLATGRPAEAAAPGVAGRGDARSRQFRRGGRLAVPALRRALPADRAQHAAGRPHRPQQGHGARGDRRERRSCWRSGSRPTRRSTTSCRWPSPRPPPPPPGTQVDAISQWGRAVLDAYPRMLQDPAFDILRRQPPNGPRPAGESAIEAIRDSLLTLDRSYLAVQGPPGTGKTYTGSRVIAELVAEHGWKVGVVAQSHAAVENMLTAVLDAGLDASRVGKKPQAGRRRPCRALDVAEGSGDSRLHHGRTDSCWAERRGTSATRSGCRAAAWTCSSSTRPASSRWRAPSPPRSPRSACCCWATRSSFRR